MFGNKQTKVERLYRIVELLRQHPQGLSQAQLAALIGVLHTTIARDLPLLEDQGILLQEANGKLSLFAHGRVTQHITSNCTHTT